jgi:enoyl-CoA hydratase
VHERFNVLANLPQPVIMAVHGYCLGAGVEVVMMGDIRIAADDAIFALPEPQVGVSIDAGGDMRLASEVGAGWAKLLAFTGRRFDAESAARIGLVQEVVPREQLVAHVNALAQEIADNAPLAVQGIKRTINFWSQQGMSEAMRFEAASAAQLFVSDDMTRGYAAKAKKEKADFEGK